MSALRLIEEDGPGPAMRLRLAGFALSLRGAGFALGHREVADAARLLATPLAERPDRLKAALQALFCSRQNELARFGALFDAFWLGRGAKRAAKITSQGLANRSPRTFEAGPGRETLPPPRCPKRPTRRPPKARRLRAEAAKAAPRGKRRCRARTSADSPTTPSGRRRRCWPNASPARCAPA